MRRSLRIFPLYYLTLVLCYFVIPLIQGVPFPDFSQQIYYWVYLQNFSTTFNWDAVGPGHFWSLGVEEHFYLFWPLIVYMLNRKKLAIAIVVMIIISIVTRIVMTAQGYEVFYFTITRFDSLTIGAILSLIELKGFLMKENSRKFLLGMVLLIVPILLLWLAFGGDGKGTIQVTKPLLIGIFYFLFLGYIVSTFENNFLKKILNTAPFSYTGKISYGLYVYHPFVYSYFLKYTKTEYMMFDFLCSVLISYIVATISFYLFENQVLRFKRYFEYKKDNVKHSMMKVA